MDKTLLKKDLITILTGVCEKDFSDYTVLNEEIKRIEKSVNNGSPYIGKYFERLTNQCGDKKCILCEKQEAENGIVCQSCIDRIAPTIGYIPPGRKQDKVDELTQVLTEESRDTNTGTTRGTDNISPNSVLCPDCGTKIEAYEKICPNCGRPIKKSKQMNFAPVLILVLAVSVIILTIALIPLIRKKVDPIGEFERLISKGETSEAVFFYEENIKFNDELNAELTERFISEIDSIKKDFVSKDTGYEETVEILKEYKEYTFVEEYLTSVKKEIEKINDARVKMKKAEDEEKKGNILKAIEIYEELKPDEEGYALAIEKIEELKQYYIDNIIKEAKDLADEKKYEEAIVLLNETADEMGHTKEMDSLVKKYNEEKYDRGVCDVRNANFGDSKETVKKYERAELCDEGVDTLSYKDSLDASDVDVFYYFNESDQLYMIIYSLSEHYSNYDYYIRDYNSFHAKLVEKYGDPSKVQNWTSNSSLVKYCDTEGEALLLGYLSKASVWKLSKMDILISLQNDAGLKLFIAYQSKMFDSKDSKNQY
ncbi:MAG: zinc-ribbon domain-containing protein [Lachnospiraceae bacterium]|nr:zinc-ribbon domain-containing protein [Lachnospiraceae bacterium]